MHRLSNAIIVVRQIIRIFCYYALCYCIPLTVEARWATVADMPYSSTYDTKLSVRADGSYDLICDMYRLIRKESGRELAAHVALDYNGDNEKVKILIAETVVTNQQKFPVKPQFIEDKAVASSPLGFDQRRQILIAFPNVEVGRQIHLKFHYIQKRPRLEGFFNYFKFISKSELVTKARWRIDSQLPLHIMPHDPYKELKIVTQFQKPAKHLIEITLSKPSCQTIVNEFGDPVATPNLFTWFSISTEKNWQRFGKQFGKLFIKELASQSLPIEFMKIVRQAKAIKDEVKQINLVIALLNQKIRYMGDWTTNAGRYLPRSLEKIQESQFADCKDFALVTAAMLQQLGYQAQIALVMRGLSEPSLEGLPGFDLFNHAMVKVTNRRGRVYWLDPTNFQSMADGIFPDIANKTVLILDPQHPAYERIPAVDPAHAVVTRQRTLIVLPQQKLWEIGSLTLDHEKAISLTGAALMDSIESIKTELFYMLLGDGTTLTANDQKELSMPPLTSRIVQKLQFKYKFERKNNLIKTNVGLALKPLHHPILANISNIAEDYVANMLIATTPSTYKQQTIIKNITVKNLNFLNQQLITPWITIKRHASINPQHQIQIDEELIVHQNLIPSSVYKTKPFDQLKRWIKDNFINLIIVFEMQPSLKK